MVPTKVGERGLKYPVDRNAPVKLVIEPHDVEFGDLLAKAGVKVPDLDDIASLVGDSDTEETTLEDFLKLK